MTTKLNKPQVTKTNSKQKPSSGSSTPGGNLAPADPVIQKSGVVVNVPHNLMPVAIRSHSNFQSLICVMNHAVGIPQLDGDIRQRDVQGRQLGVLWTTDDGEEEERAAGDEPSLGEALEGVKVDAEVGIALRGFKGVQAQNALAATAARE